MKKVTLRSHWGRICINRVAETPAIEADCSSLEAFMRYWQAHIASAPDYNADQERIIVVLLNTRLRPIGWQLISLGTVNESLARPADILRPAIIIGTYAFIVAHNHPSGDATPSEADKTLTRRVRECATLLGIRFLDHVIMTEPDRRSLEPHAPAHFSFREAGLV
jgi:DNA repair protein RadC